MNSHKQLTKAGEQTSYTLWNVFHPNSVAFIPIKLLDHRQLIPIRDAFKTMASVVKTKDGEDIIVLQNEGGFLPVAKKGDSGIFSPWSAPLVKITIGTKLIEGLRYYWDSETSSITLVKARQNFYNPGTCSYPELDQALRKYAEEKAKGVRGNFSRMGGLIYSSLSGGSSCKAVPPLGDSGAILCEEVSTLQTTIGKYDRLIQERNGTLAKLWIQHFPLSSSAANFSATFLRTKHLSALYLLSCCIEQNPVARLEVREALLRRGQTAIASATSDQEKSDILYQFPMDQLKEIGYAVGAMALSGDDKMSFVYNLVHKIQEHGSCTH